MKLFLLILIFPLFFFSQRSEKLNDALHFYGTVGVCDISYHAQDLLFPNQKIHNRFFVSIGMGLGIGFCKEKIDQLRLNGTGFSKEDFALDSWAVLCWIPFRICLNDFKSRKKKDKYKL